MFQSVVVEIVIVGGGWNRLSMRGSIERCGVIEEEHRLQTN